jgi:hypothetical protein
MPESSQPETDLFTESFCQTTRWRVIAVSRRLVVCLPDDFDSPALGFMMGGRRHCGGAAGRAGRWHIWTAAIAATASRDHQRVGRFT